MKKRKGGHSNFEKIVGEEIRFRNKYLIYNGEEKTLKNVENLMMISGGFLAPFFWYFAISNFNSDSNSGISNIELIGLMLLPIGMYSIGKLNQFKIKKKPSENEDINIWLETNGKKLIWYEFFVRSFSILTIFFVTDFEVGLLSIIYFGIFDAITLRVLSSPKTILNSKLTVFGSSCLLFAMSIYAIELIYYILPSINSGSITEIVLSRIILFLVITSIYARKSKNEIISLNSVEKRVLKFINPKVVKEVFKDDYQRLLDNLRAAKILRKIRKKEDYGVEIAMFKELLKKHSTKKSYYTGLLLGLFIFIVASIGEGFFQDLLYEPFIKPFLCDKLGILCE